MLQKIHFFSSIAVIYLFTMVTIGAALYASHTFGTPVWASTAPLDEIHPVTTTTDQAIAKATTGLPVRIRIPLHSIDLQIEEGRYDATNKSWTLSPTHAVFAVSTMPANDRGGTTFIYGHGTTPVFGKIGTSHPPKGSVAEILTDNDHVFSYTLQSIHNLKPNDTSILRNPTSGPPRLIIQTCTGIFSEWRTEFIYSLQKVR